MSGIFVSYRRSDSQGEAGRLFDDLVQHFDEQTVFMDVSAIEAGRDFRKAIEEGVTKCGVLLVVMGPEWVGTKNEAGRRRLDDPADFVRIETASALKRDIPVIPVLVRGATMPAAEQLPEDLKELAYRNCIELTHARWRSDVQLLLEALRRLLGDTRQIQPSARSRSPSSSALAPATRSPSGSTLRAATKSEKLQADSFSPVGPAVIERVSRELAHYIGPIASIVVNRAAAQCTSVEELYHIVAAEIDSRAERNKFLERPTSSPTDIPISASPATQKANTSSPSRLPHAHETELAPGAVPEERMALSSRGRKYWLAAVAFAILLGLLAVRFISSARRREPSTQSPRNTRLQASEAAPAQTKAVAPANAVSGTNEATRGAPPSARQPKIEEPTINETKISDAKPAETRPAQRVRVSPEVIQSLLIKKVMPSYPPLAQSAHIQGLVILDADISKDGAVEDLKLISGHPLLVPAAIDAVKQWRYEPYMMGGEPRLVKTQVSVNFTLKGG